LSLPAASTISSGRAPASPSTIALLRSRDTCGTGTPDTASSLRRTATTRARVARAAGSSMPARGPATTTDSA